ncbi:MAG: alpha-amylase family glycosyl hydrolase [Anaerolineae bacterium]
MWPEKPFIYQINTAVWLNSLRVYYQNPDITLTTVPEEVLIWLESLNVDAIWLTGVWQRSAAARKSALNYTHEYRPVLPDLTEADVIGSAYAVGAYTVDTQWGGREGLAHFRQRLRQRGMRLILDYVPNHVATDHEWVTEKPHFMVRGNKDTAKHHPGMFFITQNSKGQQLIIAHGRDPYFPSWIDTAQVNAFSNEYRKAARDVLLDIAEQCDGVRCDMAMLMVNSIFSRTWGAYLLETAPNVEFWEELIPAVKAQHPHFLFAAEVYWDMEYQLQQQGFDLTYDKLLYDRLLSADANALRLHLTADPNYQKRMVRFIENHDEPRAAASLGIERSRPAAVVIATLPGATLLHDGQFTGRYMKLPIQIARQPDETPHHALSAFYMRLLRETRHPIYQHGHWHLLDIQPTPDWGVKTHNNVLAYGWEMDGEYRLIVVNITHVWSQAIVRMNAWHGLGGMPVRLRDALNGACHYREGDQLLNGGLYVELEPFQAHIYHVEPLRESEDLREFAEATAVP